MEYAVDVAVVAFVVLAALRGWWRGFLREFFGLLALAVGLYVASKYTDALSPWLADKVSGPQALRDGIAFVALFVLANLLTNIAGFVLDRVAAALLLTGVNRAAGAFFGAGKAAAVAAVVLLFVHLFPPLSTLDERVMASPVGRSLVQTAGDVLRVSVPPSNVPPPAPEPPRAAEPPAAEPQ
jgi:membrane protein required for colicin V production